MNLAIQSQAYKSDSDGSESNGDFNVAIHCQAHKIDSDCSHSNDSMNLLIQDQACKSDGVLTSISTSAVKL